MSSLRVNWFPFCNHQELPLLSDPAGVLQLTQALRALISLQEERSWTRGTLGWAGQLIQKISSAVLVRAGMSQQTWSWSPPSADTTSFLPCLHFAP